MTVAQEIYPVAAWEDVTDYENLESDMEMIRYPTKHTLRKYFVLHCISSTNLACMFSILIHAKVVYDI